MDPGCKTLLDEGINEKDYFHDSFMATTNHKQDDTYHFSDTH